MPAFSFCGAAIRAARVDLKFTPLWEKSGH